MAIKAAFAVQEKSRVSVDETSTGVPSARFASSKSDGKDKRHLPLCFVIMIAGILAFLGMERGFNLWGFPLDDAWIHQTYARALAAGEGWSYAGGPPSAGSTSPAWTVLQVPAYWLHIPPVNWSYGLGGILFAIVIVLSYQLARRLEPAIAWIAAVAVALEWHLIWASLSGMETILFTAWTLLIWWICMYSLWESFPMEGLWIGIILGVGVWIRPEAILVSGLGGLCLLGRFLIKKEWQKGAGLAIGSFVCGLPFFWHNLQLGGRLWPNTWYAKPIEYASLQGVNIFSRIGAPLLALGAGSLAIFLWLAWLPWIRAVWKRRWREAVPFFWGVCHIGLYAIQLPVTYQHARYDMPVIPIFLVYGMAGFSLLRNLFQNERLGRLIYRTCIGSVIVVSVIFLAMGARQYAQDVGVIETEMVQASQWIRDTTPANARIAAHDVGALGYWGNRKIIDLGGLTDVDAWYLLAGRETVRQFLDRKQADYWMTFPDVYAGDTLACRPIYSTHGSYAPLFGAANMAVYKWPEGCSP